MSKKTVFTRENEVTEELRETVKTTHKGVVCVYDRLYCLDYEVNEYTGKINREKKARFCTKDQVNRNLKALKNAYSVELNKQIKE